MLFLVVLMSSCTGLGKLSEGEKLVSKAKIKYLDKKNINNFGKLNSQLYEVMLPKPNTKFLWMRPGAAIYNSVREPKKEKGFRNWMKYKLGSAPVLFDESICENMNVAFENRLYHKGYFNAKSAYSLDQKEKTVQIEYQITANQPYIIDTVIFPQPSDSISTAIFQSRKETEIIKGKNYDLDVLKHERIRIDQELKNEGYYYFDQDYLIFEADSTVGDHKVKLNVLLKYDNPEKSNEVFKIGKIYVAEDFRLSDYHPDTTIHGEYTVLSMDNYIKPNVLTNGIFLYHDSTYSKQDHNYTLRYLQGLGAYKYVNTRYTESTENLQTLDAYLTLSPSQKMSVSAELNAISKSNNFAGPGVRLGFKSKNFFRGAELFSVNLSGRFEKQYTKDEQGDTAYELSIDANLDIPKTFPFRTKKIARPYVPFTSINVGTGIYSRVSLYKFHTYNTGLEYSWKKNQYLTHKFKLIDISVTNLLDASDSFKDYLLLNPSIRKSFEEQFIIGSSYNMIYNHLGNPNKSQYYVSVGADPSGNLVGLVHHLTSSKDNNAENPATIFGAPVSQYFRFRFDGRYYFKMGKEPILATRIQGGIGIPYGNSTVMPYVKQFYAGGTNSIRAFRARSLGPGTYQPPDSLNNVLIDQTGEIKLEANMEYRFPILGYLKGAVFTDMGNVWLAREDSLRPGGKFEATQFYKEFAVGLGVGLRIDVDLVVLRFDWAFPVRKPYLPEGQRWVFDKIDPFDKPWRRENLIWNISIGYPF